MKWTDPPPFWRRMGAALVVFAFAVLFSYTNASNFDKTEYKMLAELAVILFAREAVGKWIDKDTPQNSG